jgi:hypothetical protein
VASRWSSQVHASRLTAYSLSSELQLLAGSRAGQFRTHAYLANVFARAGRTQDALRELQALQEEIARHRYVGAFNIAIVYAALRDKDSTFAWLERALDDHSIRPYLFDPTFDLIRSDSRYATLLARMHLPYRPAAR